MKTFLLFLSLMLICLNDKVKVSDKIPDDTNPDYHQALLNFQKNKHVKGLSFAIFNNSEIIWSECAGKTTSGLKVNDETLFSIQSISKNFTAIAALRAAQAGLLDLDIPISQYLPEFRVNSCFEDHPEKSITVRMLLSHTAGFTHEAPLGNNYDLRPCSYKEHLKSIELTWLKFPAGTSYSYSNIGFDLVAQIIERQSNKSFDQFLKEQVLQPLEMTGTTTDDKEFQSIQNKTEGKFTHADSKHYTIPLIGSGAVYTNLKDFIRYTQMLMNYGQSGNKTFIDRRFIFEMLRIKFMNYGLGIYLGTDSTNLFINHNGGGYGYSATMLWFPEFNLGSVMMCNGPSDTFNFCLYMIYDYIRNNGVSKNKNVTIVFDSINCNSSKNKDILNRSKFSGCNGDSIFRPEWKRYLGKYNVLNENIDFKWYVKVAQFLGFGHQKINLAREGQELRYSGTFGKGKLKEFLPGLFLTEDGEAIDFRTENPTFKNIHIKKRNI